MVGNLLNAASPATTGQRPLLSLQHVTKTYHSTQGNVLALQDVTLDVRQGEFISIVGRSGCGKSTLLKIVAGISPVSGGSVRLEGAEVRGAATGLSMVFQTPVLLDWRDVLGNVMLPLEILHADTKTGRERAMELLRIVGLTDFANRYPSELSGGMQQRVSICRALVSDPSLLLMDEPFGALDALTRDEMAIELLRVWEQTHKTIIFVTHSIDEAVLLSDRIVVMSPRPGRVKDVFDVNVPRPRDANTRYDPRFTEESHVIRTAIYET